MSNEKTTIHEFDIKLIYEYFASSKRQGPGNENETIKALSFINGLHKKSKIADIGCGTGGQTITLAQNTNGEIIGIDIWQDFIDQLNNEAKNQNLQNRLKGMVGDMQNLPFQEEELDVIWSEGAIYNIGFEKGLNEWRKYLKNGGYIAVTENTWFTEERPAEIEEFWHKTYPQIDTIANKVGQMQKAGFLPVAIYTLPETVWTDYYAITKKLQAEFSEKYKGNKTVEEFVASQKYEAELYDKYKRYYGYVFYIGKKL